MGIHDVGDQLLCDIVLSLEVLCNRVASTPSRGYDIDKGYDDRDILLAPSSILGTARKLRSVKL